MIRSTSKTVTTTPTSIVTSTGATSANPKRVVIQVPTGGQAVFIGGVTRTGSDSNGGASYTLSTTNGLSLASPSTTSFDLWHDDELYAVVAATTQAIIVLENQTN